MKRFCHPSYLILGFCFITLYGHAQNVGINATGAAPTASAGLDVDFTNKGVLVPRVALTATNSASPVASPATSLLVYNTATAGSGATAVTPGYYYWSGSAWVRFSTGGDDWKILGNANTTSGTNFLGTTNAQALDFRTNNTLRFRIANGNQVQAMSNGTAALPFYSWANSTGTGFWSPGTNILGFSTAGVERMRILANGNIGINETNPSEKLHVSGNFRLQGAFMPNNQAGTADQFLLSNGVGSPPKWSNFSFLNASATSAIGKFFSGLFNLNSGSTLTLTLNDIDCKPNSTCSTTWVGPLPAGPDYSKITITVEARTGQWIFYIHNGTSYSFTNMQFSYLAFY